MKHEYERVVRDLNHRECEIDELTMRLGVMRDRVRFLQLRVSEEDALNQKDEEVEPEPTQEELRYLHAHHPSSRASYFGIVRR